MTDPDKPSPADDALGAFVARASLRKHRSHFVTDGLDRAPYRAFLRGTGVDDDAMQKIHHRRQNW